MEQSKSYRKASWWQLLIVAFAAIGPNIYQSYVGYISYFLTDVVGFGVILAGSFVTIMRIWDAVTDVGMGIVVDKTNSKFGRFRPYILIGGVASILISFLMIRATPMVPEGGARKVFFVAMYLLFVLSTTMMACSQRSAAQLLTNDPKQRATFGMFSGIALTILYASVPILVFSHIMPATHGFNQQFFNTLLNVVLVVVIISLILREIVFRKVDVYDPNRNVDAKTDKVALKDYIELLTKNRPFLMLILSAGTDKLASTLQGNATVVVIIYAIVAGNSKLSSAANSYTMIPSILMILLGLGALGRKFGSRRSLVYASWGGAVVCVLSILLWVFGDPHTLTFPGFDGFNGWTFFTIAYLVLWCLMKGLNLVATNALNPMLADVIDYEEYRSGKFRPGLIGSMFNLADKVISSLGPTIIAILCAMIGFKDQLPTVDTPYSNSLFAIGLLGMYGLALIGLIVNLVCLKFYDLTPEKMENVRAELAKRKAAV